MMANKRVEDRRIQKTRALLYEALSFLIHEKPYDEIVVKEILDRANVGRSTFYTHFRGKDELLASGLRDMLRTVPAQGLPASGKGYERIIRFSLPVFEHIQQHRQAGAAAMGSRGQAIIHQHLQKILVELIADDLGKVFYGHRKMAAKFPPHLLVQYVASTFVLVLNWWAESKGSLSANEINDLFRALTIPTPSASLDSSDASGSRQGLWRGRSGRDA